MITTVVFDLDDTLYDEMDYCHSGFRAVARFLGTLSAVPCVDDLSGCLWRHFTAGNRTRTFNAALEEMGIAHDDALIAQLIEVYRHHRPDLTLPADSRQVLETLKPNYRLALLTDGFMPAQRLKVIALGLEPWFETIVYTEELGRAFWKPSPVGFQTLLQRLGVTADCAVYVGDNETKDFIAPNALGMLTIQVQRPARLHPDTGAATNAAARLKAEEIAALPDLLARY